MFNVQYTPENYTGNLVDTNGEMWSLNGLTQDTSDIAYGESDSIGSYRLQV